MSLLGEPSGSLPTKEPIGALFGCSRTSQAASPWWLGPPDWPGFLDHRHLYFDPVNLAPGMPEI
jgi:hypothetical protein